MGKEELKVCGGHDQTAEPAEKQTLEVKVGRYSVIPMVRDKPRHICNKESNIEEAPEQMPRSMKRCLCTLCCKKRRKAEEKVCEQHEQPAEPAEEETLQVKVGRFTVIPMAPEEPRHICDKKSHIPEDPEQIPHSVKKFLSIPYGKRRGNAEEKVCEQHEQPAEPAEEQSLQLLRAVMRIFCLPCGKKRGKVEKKVHEQNEQPAEPAEEQTPEVEMRPVEPWVPVRCQHRHLHRRRRAAAVSGEGHKAQVQVGRFSVVPVVPEASHQLRRKKSYVAEVPEEEPWEWNF